MDYEKLSYFVEKLLYFIDSRCCGNKLIFVNGTKVNSLHRINLVRVHRLSEPLIIENFYFKVKESQVVQEEIDKYNQYIINTVSVESLKEAFKFFKDASGTNALYLSFNSYNFSLRRIILEVVAKIDYESGITTADRDPK